MSARARRSEGEMLADIRAAALAELTEVGIGRMSMAGIAQRSGAARTSLHRRWSSPVEILLEAVADSYPQETVSPGLDDLRGDLIRALASLVDWLATPTALAVEAILLERGRHPELARALYERVFDQKGGRFTRTVLMHYAEHGHLDPVLVTDVVTDIGEALVLKHLADNGSPPDAVLLARIVDEAVLPAVGRPPVGQREL